MKTKKTPRKSVVNDNVQGAQRERIIADHLMWLGVRNAEREAAVTEGRDFTRAPLARWSAEHDQAVARKRGMNSRSYRNSK